MRTVLPTQSLLRGGKYIPACATDIRKTWERLEAENWRAEMEARAERSHVIKGRVSWPPKLPTKPATFWGVFNEYRAHGLFYRLRMAWNVAVRKLEF